MAVRKCMGVHSPVSAGASSLFNSGCNSLCVVVVRETNFGILDLQIAFRTKVLLSALSNTDGVSLHVKSSKLVYKRACVR
jgi:hypothetical protein